MKREFCFISYKRLLLIFEISQIFMYKLENVKIARSTRLEKSGEVFRQ